MKLIAHASTEAPTLTPDGAERRILSYSDNLMLVQFNFGADVKSWEHSHPHEQVGYVVSGEIDVFMEGAKPVRLQPGGSY
jgi:quercetin dioxygenase-like cupin family protein